MIPKNPSVLDLFVLAKGEIELDPLLANDLLTLAHQTLGRLDPEYRAKGCKKVLDELDSQKRFASHDLAVLCYEAISYIENRTRS